MILRINSAGCIIASCGHRAHSPSCFPTVSAVAQHALLFCFLLALVWGCCPSCYCTLHYLSSLPGAAWVFVWHVCTCSSFCAALLNQEAFATDTEALKANHCALPQKQLVTGEYSGSRHA